MKQRVIFVLALLCLLFTSYSQCDTNACFPEVQTINDVFLEVGCGNWDDFSNEITNNFDQTIGSFKDINCVTIQLSRENILNDSASLKIPNIPATLFVTDPNDALIEHNCTVSMSLEYTSGQQNETFTVQDVQSQSIHPLLIEEGYNEVKIRITLSKTSDFQILAVGVRDFEIFRQINSPGFNDIGGTYEYEDPDIAWTVSIDNYVSPCSNSYTTDIDI